MIVTINTDASFSGKFKIGTFAFWIVCDAGRIMKAGAFKSKVKNSTEAEIKCIVNALHALKGSGFAGVSKVIINTDCLAFYRYMKNRNLRSAESKEYQKVSIALVQKYQLKKGWIEVRHVKAHSGVDEKRKYVNDWCDKAAKEVMGELLKTK